MHITDAIILSHAPAVSPLLVCLLDSPDSGAVWSVKYVIQPGKVDELGNLYSPLPTQLSTKALCRISHSAVKVAEGPSNLFDLSTKSAR